MHCELEAIVRPQCVSFPWIRLSSMDQRRVDGVQFRYLVQGANLVLKGHRRVSLGLVSLPSKGTGGGPPLQAEANLQKG